MSENQKLTYKKSFEALSHNTFDSLSIVQTHLRLNNVKTAIKLIDDVLKNTQYVQYMAGTVKEDLTPYTEENYTKIFAVINGDFYDISIPTVFAEEIKQNNDVIDKEIFNKIIEYKEKE